MGSLFNNGRIDDTPVHMYMRTTLGQKLRLISRMAQFAESLALCSNIAYAVVIGRKGWEKQGWSRREHGREVAASNVFAVESD